MHLLKLFDEVRTQDAGKERGKIKLNRRRIWYGYVEMQHCVM